MTTVTYTNATRVREIVENIDSNVTDAIINEYIVQAEGLIDATMGTSFKNRGIFDSVKHRLIERTATRLAAIDALSYDISNQFGSSIGSLHLESLKGDVARCLALLADPKVVKLLEGESK